MALQLNFGATNVSCTTQASTSQRRRLSDTTLQSFLQFAQAFAIGLLNISRMLILTRADASSHSLREPYRLPHGGAVCPTGCCEGAPHGYVGDM